MSHNKSGSEFTAFLVGGLIGVVAGLLIAPKSGRETREDIEEWVDEAVERTKDSTQMLNERLHAAKANIEDRITQLNKKAKTKVRTVVEEFKEENPFADDDNN